MPRIPYKYLVTTIRKVDDGGDVDQIVTPNKGYDMTKKDENIARHIGYQHKVIILANGKSKVNKLEVKVY